MFNVFIFLKGSLVLSMKIIYIALRLSYQQIPHSLFTIGTRYDEITLKG